MLSLLTAIALVQACDEPFVCTSNPQTVDGYKTWTKLGLFTDSYPVGGETVGVYAPSGIGTKTIVAPVVNSGIILKGRRADSDTDANITILSEVWRDGAMICVYSGPSDAGTMAPLLCINGNGDIPFGNTINAAGQSAPGGSLVDRSGWAGHAALVREPGHYLLLSGGLGAREDVKNADGSDPICDGGSWTRHVDGGGCSWNFAGHHGDNTSASAYPMHAGFLAEWSNPLSGTGARTDHRAFIDLNGAYLQNHQLPRVAFPGPCVKVMTNRGEMYYGACRSTLMYAFDLEHYYFMTGATGAENPDAGWVQLAEQPTIDALLAEVAALKARVTDLEAACH